MILLPLFSGRCCRSRLVRRHSTNMVNASLLRCVFHCNQTIAFQNKLSKPSSAAAAAAAAEATEAVRA